MPIDLALAFTAGHTFKRDDATYKVKLVEVGNLTVVSGKIFAADPLSYHKIVPFERTVKKGSYLVTASVASIKYKKLEGRNQDRCGAAMVRFKAGVPAKWVLATKKGQKLSALKPGHIYGYGVDAGTGCFADVVAAEALDFLNRVEFANDNWEGYLLGKIESYLGAPTWGATRITDPKTKANVVCFPSGWGDGFYASYWGVSKTGAPLCLATDFAVYPSDDAACESS